MTPQTLIRIARHAALTVIASLPFATFEVSAQDKRLLIASTTSTESSRVSQLSNVGAQAGFRLELFPQRTWQFNLYDDIARVVQGGPDFGVSLAIYNGIRNTGGFDIVFAPSGGIAGGPSADVRFTPPHKRSTSVVTRFPRDLGRERSRVSRLSIDH